MFNNFLFFFFQAETQREATFKRKRKKTKRKKKKKVNVICELVCGGDSILADTKKKSKKLREWGNTCVLFTMGR